MAKDKSEKKAKKEIKNMESKPSKKDLKKVATEKAKTPVITSKEILANGPGKKGKGKRVEVAKPPPPPEDSSQESSDDSSEDEQPNAGRGTVAHNKPAKVPVDYSSSSSDESTEDKKPKKNQKANGTTRHTGAKLPSKDDSSDSDSTDDEKSKAVQIKTAAKKQSDSSSNDSSEEEEEEVPTKPAPKGAALASQAVASSDSESDSSDSSDSESTSSDGKIPKAKSSTQKASASESSSSSDSEDDDDADVEMKDATIPAVTKGKRKADDDAAGPVKKLKVAEPSGVTDEEVKTLFVGQLSWNVDNDWLSTEFAEAGDVVSARVQMDRQSGRSRGFGYVEFATAAAAQSALEKFQGKEIDGRAIKLDLSTPRQPNPTARAKQFGDVANAPSATLFVGNISWNTTEDMLWEHFGAYGEVSSVRVPTDRETGKPKGFGYVEFSDVEGAKKGYEGATGSEIDGRYIRLDYSQPRDSNGGGGGFGGGGGGFGGRGRGGDRGGRGGGRGFGDRGGRGGGRGRGGDRGGRGGRGGGRGAPRGGARTGGITSFEGRKKTFD